MSISDLVNVTITRESAPVSSVGFGTLMILGVHKVFNERIKFYSNTTELLDDGFVAADAEYKCAQLAFSQSLRPTQIAIGRRTVDDVVVEITTATPGNTYTVTINGTDFAHTATMGQDATAIAGALVTAINNGSEPVTADDNEDGSFELSADTGGTAYTLSVNGSLEIATLVANDTITNDLNAIVEASDNFYAIMITERDDALVQDVAAFVEEKVKIFGYASDDVDITDSQEEEDIATTLKDLNYNRTFILYHHEAQSFPEAAFFGLQLSREPGTSNWAYKTLTGVNTTDLSTSKREAVRGKNANTYEERADRNITFEGVMASGEYIDAIRGDDWLRVRMSEDILDLQTTVGKIPYTNQGIAQIESVMRGRIKIAVERGVLSNDPEPVIIVPLIKDIPAADRANRNLPSVKFIATRAGAINRVTVNGTVTV